MDLASLTVAPFHRYDRAELRAHGFFDGVARFCAGEAEKATRCMFETPFCGRLVEEIEERVGQRILPLWNGIYFMLTPDSHGEGQWHIDGAEWAFENTYNLWMPLHYLDSTTDGMEVMTSQPVIDAIADGYSEIEELAGSPFCDEVREIEGLDGTDYLWQHDADMRYRVWRHADIEKTCVRPEAYSAHLLNARVFHRTAPTITSRIVWGFKFALADGALSSRAAMGSDPVKTMAWKFFRRHRFTSPEDYRRRVVDKVVELQARRDRENATKQRKHVAFTQQMRRLAPLVLRFFDDQLGRDELDAAIRVGCSAMARA